LLVAIFFENQTARAPPQECDKSKLRKFIENKGFKVKRGQKLEIQIKEILLRVIIN
jgi:hypothetical protein